MSRKVSPRPKGFRTVTPVLTVAGAAGAIDFYGSVFGAEEGARIYREDGVSIAHSELKIGDSQVILCDENPYFGIHAPTTIGASPVVVHLYLTDIDATFERAIEAGATVLVPLADTYWGERYGKFIDPYGHVWSIGKRVENLTADEIAERAAALAAPATFETVEGFDTAAAIVAVDGEVDAVSLADEASQAA